MQIIITYISNKTTFRYVFNIYIQLKIFNYKVGKPWSFNNYQEQYVVENNMLYFEILLNIFK